jgi:hypothetical protein
MNKNREVLEFTYDTGVDAVLGIDRIIDSRFAPLGAFVPYSGGREITYAQLNHWWHKRPVPQNRLGLRQVEDALGLSMMELMRQSHGLSLSDQYWVKEAGSALEWSDVNFFTNPFAGDIGLAMLNGPSPTTPSWDGSTATPDASTVGQAQKMWRCEGERRLLVKAGRDEVINQEPYNEVIATQLYSRLLAADEYVPYWLEDVAGIARCACECILDANQELITARDLMNYFPINAHARDHEHFIRCCEALGLGDGATFLSKMVTCDAILANSDRHYANFGIIRDVETLEVVDFAPFWDNDIALFSTSKRVLPSSIWDFTTNPFFTAPQVQLDAVTGNLDWFSPDALNGFDDVIGDYLGRSGWPRLEDGQQRIEQVAAGAMQRIEQIKG